MEEPMTTTAIIQASEQGLLGLEEIRGLLVPLRSAVGPMPMPTLVTDPEMLSNAAPLSPAFPLNAARLLSRLTRNPIGGKIAAVLRPCEIRAFIELVKLKQGRTDELILIGIDCMGAFRNRDAAALVSDDPIKSDDDFCRAMLADSEVLPEGMVLATACRACEYPLPEKADLAVHLIGADLQKGLPVTAGSKAGEALIREMDLSGEDVSSDRGTAVEAFIAERIVYRDRMFADTAEAVGSLEKLSRYFAACVNCYNCRVACPVCYCRECVFLTGAFDHEPYQYLRWARRKGAIKMPTDTMFYHLTRLAHMSTACVGCGQCSNACPNDIPVMELFRTVAHGTQQAFGYTAGRSIDDPPPLSVFREDEFQEVVGIK
jgi:formate dehydrogenase subunit beta